MSEPKHPRFITGKQIAAKMEISYRHFHRRKRELHLDECRDHLCPRRFITEQVEKKLRDNWHDVVF